MLLQSSVVGYFTEFKSQVANRVSETTESELSESLIKTESRRDIWRTACLFLIHLSRVENKPEIASFAPQPELEPENPTRLPPLVRPQQSILE